MTLIRPELRARLYHWREVIIAAAIMALGAWIAGGGGPLLLGIGVLLVLTGLALGINAWRRLRFASDGQAPGVVQVVEGQIAYFAPEQGGFAALDDLAELRLEPGPPGGVGPVWVLEQTGAEALRIPVAASGADQLFDAFASLPGIDMNALSAAVAEQVPRARVLWRRHRRTALT
ncbi:hypothetical protein [Alkalilacustris brevis]|uniref:hypothetical protein n=1 Tax=Alkalilacustris brevis TaxID=2026338 RepID=UPI000E0D79E9|nr:hypothetical protein [Alkalilacustris brevis]